MNPSAWRRRAAVHVGALLLAMLACAGARAGESASAAASVEYLPYGSVADNPRPVAAPHQGELFRVSQGGRVAYLFGTVHMGTRGFYPLPPEVERALTEVLHAQGISMASMAGYKPWLVANLLLSMELERKGYRRSEGVEQALLTQARRHGLKVAQLESAEYQLALYDTMGEAEAVRYLEEVLDGLENGRALRTAQAVIEAWSSGDARALDVVLQESTTGPGLVAEFTRRVLLGRRNPDMASQIERLMREDSVTFVGVGLLHLLGANGLPQLLAQRGYLVERVY